VELERSASLAASSPLSWCRLQSQLALQYLLRLRNLGKKILISTDDTIPKGQWDFSYHENKFHGRRVAAQAIDFALIRN
jgi:hypothetical protein